MPKGIFHFLLCKMLCRDQLMLVVLMRGCQNNKLQNLLPPNHLNLGIFTMDDAGICSRIDFSGNVFYPPLFQSYLFLSADNLFHHQPFFLIILAALKESSAKRILTLAFRSK